MNQSAKCYNKKNKRGLTLQQPTPMQFISVTHTKRPLKCHHYKNTKMRNKEMIVMNFLLTMR